MLNFAKYRYNPAMVEAAQVTAWLEDVESIILRRIPDLDARVTAGNPPAATVVRVEANAVIRKIRNPDGKVSETIDDYTYRLGGDARYSAAHRGRG